MTMEATRAGARTGARRVRAADGHQIHATIRGVPDAPVTVVLAHGWTMASRFWDGQAEALGRFARVVTFDQRGHGRSGPAFGPQTDLDVLGDDLRAVVEQTTPEGPVVLVGHSMGGMAILALAGRHPAWFARRVAGVALVSTSSGGAGDTDLGLGGRRAAFARRLVERSLATARRGSRLSLRLHRWLHPDRRMVRLAAARFLLGPEAEAGLDRTCAELIHDTDPRSTGAWFFAMRRYDRHAALERLAGVPVMVLHGERDLLLGIHHARRIAEAVPDARLVTVQDAGHMLPLERPALVSERLAELVSAAVPGSVPAGGVGLMEPEPGQEPEPPRPDHRVVVVGTGFAGLGMAIRLKRAGVEDFVVLEKADDVGGTWRENTYPGCACDVQSHLYSFSFAPNPDWTRMFAPRSEIQGYLRGCADRFGIRPHIRFGASFEGADYDEASATWTVRLGDGSSLTTRHLVLGLGALHQPAVPELPGLERFRGTVFHSAEWDHGYDLAGKRVAVIGTGASAIQFVPAIAPDVANLHLFQRTPPWIIPKMDRAISARERRLYRRLPFLQRLYRSKIYWQLEGRVLGFAVDPRLMKLAEMVARWHLRRQVPDRALRAKLTPDYAIGCKRILISNDYYPALLRGNVELVTGGIAEVREGSIVGTDGVEREVDAIILGTGFKVGHGIRHADLTGAGGVSLRETWARGAEAFLGTTVAGFPNLFVLLGPNTGLGHTSQVLMIEAQIGHALAAMRRAGEGAIEVRPEVQRSFNRDIQGRLAGAVWESGCASWYLDEDGVNRTIWPGFTWRFRQRTRRLSPSHYRTVPARTKGVVR